MHDASLLTSDDAENAFFTHQINRFILGADLPSPRNLASAVLGIVLALGAVSYYWNRLQYRRKVIPEDWITCPKRSMVVSTGTRKELPSEDVTNEGPQEDTQNNGDVYRTVQHVCST